MASLRVAVDPFVALLVGGGASGVLAEASTSGFDKKIKRVMKIARRLDASYVTIGVGKGRC